MNIATISDIQVNMGKKLNEETKKNLVKIIEEEFRSQSTIYNEKIKEHSDKVMEAYQKKVGFNKLRESIRKAEQSLRDAKNKLEETGLNESGDLIKYHNDDIVMARVREVRRLLSQITMSEPNAVKNKIIARLWMADTNGEATVILREVLGNGIIPTVTKDQLLTYQPEEKK